MTYRRIISRLDRQGFVDTMRECGWPLLVARAADHETDTSFGLMFEAYEDLFVSWIEPLEQPLVSIVELTGGDDRPHAHEEVRAAVLPVDDETLLSLPQVTQDERGTALSYFAIGVACPLQYEPRFWETLMEGLKNESSLIRQHVLLGLDYVSWSGDAEVLASAGESDAVPEIRGMARTWLRRHGLQSQ